MQNDSRARMTDAAHLWQVSIDVVTETERSIVAYGHRDEAPVVLKVVKLPGDEWRSGEVTEAFGSSGMVRVMAHMPGAVLLERAVPGTPLVELTRQGRDDEATAILADLIGSMQPGLPPASCPRAARLARGFEWYRERRDSRIQPSLVERAADTYAELCETQRSPRLLHGDLHHYNVLQDRARGWVAIDPKGVVAELEFEIGAILRNPFELPAVCSDPKVTARRIVLISERLSLDADRVRRWHFAQRVLSDIWTIQDEPRISNGVRVV